MQQNHDDDTGPPLFSRGRRPRQALGLGLLALGLTLPNLGCGSDGEPLEDFVGTWTLTRDTTQTNTFRLLCPTDTIDVQFPLFTSASMRLGTLSDLYEEAGPSDCQFAFDATPSKATLAILSPDPYTAKQAGCTLSLGSDTDPITGDTLEVQLVLMPSTWEFRLKPPVKGKAPAAQLFGHATASFRQVDVDATPQTVLESSDCTYDVLANLDKVARD